MPEKHLEWIRSLSDLPGDDQPLRRAAEIALRALIAIITSKDLTDTVPAFAAYDELRDALEVVSVPTRY